ncbi:hypothetical protein [Spirosoma endbachense]|uniref:Uncharacterized protein n=1 Tax=Spirosoma endbachense TaxID=2666025 RepID=A0A6P1W2A6_9BACT|nr:hypothetical protein [Spirosoma endbachense]QHV99024.1 hypothetical protein GJR95_30235 [Spirosoma endbachense]
MKKQKAQKKKAEQFSQHYSGPGTANKHRGADSTPRNGILMHIDELRNRLKRLQTRFGVDPSLLPEIVHG